MILSLEEEKVLCEWLQERGLELWECACVLVNMEIGSSFSIALLKVFENRKKNMEMNHGKDLLPDWVNPIAP